MTRAVWKYLIEATDEQTVEMPAESRILTVRTQNGNACIWAMVDPSAHRVRRTFQVIPTGLDFDESGLHYVGTFEMQVGRSLIFHLFEKERCPSTIG